MKNETSKASQLTEKVCWCGGVCAQNDGSAQKFDLTNGRKVPRNAHGGDEHRFPFLLKNFTKIRDLIEPSAKTAAAFLFWMWITIKSRSGKDDNCNPIAHWPVWQRRFLAVVSARLSSVCVCAAAHQFRTLTVTNEHLIEENWGNPKPRFSNLATSLTDFTERKRQGTWASSPVVMTSSR